MESCRVPSANKILFFLIASCLILPSFVLAEDKIKGKYEVIGSIEKLKNAKQVEMIEFFNYSCGHCYKFLETSKKLHQKFKDKLYHKKYPIFWGEQTALPAKAFYITDELGLEGKFTQELFDTNFKLHINIFQPRVIQRLSQHYKIEQEIREGMKSPTIEAKVNESLALAKTYKANETPTIILNKVLKVTPSISGGTTEMMTENLELIIGDILGYN
ncbi:MAG: thioredoxin domain-containing protein [Nitrospina sp.]|jgi:thiol:disulfide interchange protein DsbA|nr:thioredoxin domain-containing protein [Nitrospina sp.]MBT5258067.1 thioredoxin domain-containing protein [Nitrospina sp.]MBT6663189.1 thioredoxin domain-containing protein [Nitrospina sp.]